MAAKETGTKEVSFYSQTLTVKPCVLSVLYVPNGNRPGGTYRTLLAEVWDKAEFRIATNNGGPIKSFAVCVEITGRTVQMFRKDKCVKVKVTVPGDCEPDGESFPALLVLQEGLNFEYKG